jgi:hypothetical protein
MGTSPGSECASAPTPPARHSSAKPMLSCFSRETVPAMRPLMKEEIMKPATMGMKM